MKPRLKFDLFEKEIKFYEYMNMCESTLSLSNSFIPKYFGIYEENCNGDSKTTLPYIVLEDLTIGYVRPNLIDIKMGQQTYEPTASSDKISREILKYPFQTKVGFRITGFKAFNKLLNEYITVDKHFGRGLLPESVDCGLALFFFNGISFHAEAIRAVIVQLRDVLAYMQIQTQFHYYCSSILIIYDTLNGDYSASGEDSSPVRSDSSTCTSPPTSSSSSRESASPQSHNPLPLSPLGQEDNSTSPTELVEALSEAFQTSDQPSLPDESPSVSSLAHSSVTPFAPQTPPRVTVKMIDFAHTITPPATSCASTTPEDSSATPNNNNNNLDVGYVHGVQQLIERLTNILQIVSSKDEFIIGEFTKSMQAVFDNRLK